MIDYFALAVSHGLMLIAAWFLVTRRDLDDERPESTKKPLKRP